MKKLKSNSQTIGTVTKMTVTDALAKIKLYDNKILDKINRMTFVDVKSASNPICMITRMAYPDFVDKIKSDKESLEQLIINRQKLKSAVIISNVETKITLSESNGIVPQVISVAEAIEMKKSIHLYKEVLNKMSKDYKAAKGVHEDKSAELDDYLQTIAQKKVGFDMSDAKDTKEAVNSMRDFIKSEQETRTPVLVDPIKITSEIERYSEFISEFESEIDRKLSISNAITEIEVAV